MLAGELSDATAGEVESFDAACLSRRLLNHVRLYDTVLFPAALMAAHTYDRVTQPAH